MPEKVLGLIREGNIDLARQPRVMNPDGSISTVRSMSFAERKGGPEILIPTVSIDGRILSEDEAITQYYQTGRHLGMFQSPRAADRYAQRLHEDYAAGLYDRSGKVLTTINGVPIEPAVSHGR